MANLQPRRDKSGKLISYSVRVHRGRGADGRQLKPWTTSFTVQPGWSEKTAKRKAEAFAATFERQCREGLTSDTRQTFEQYAEYVLALREQRGDSHKTLVDYRNMTRRIYPELGHIKLRDLQAHHLNTFYGKLMQPGQNKRTGGGLSAKTILRYHRFISIVLAQAVRESLVPFNAASMLLYAGMDVVSVASRLGHSQVSTTTDVYAHVLAEADVKSADILSDIYFKNTHAG